MFNNYITRNLEENEEVIEIIRRYYLTLAFPLFIYFVVILVDFFFLTWLLRRGTWGLVVFSVIFIFFVLLAVRSWVIWSLNVFVVTSKRLIDIDQKGFFERVVSECTYEKIQDVSYKIKGVFQTLLHFGNIQIQTAGNQANLEINCIKDPHKVQELITSRLRKEDKEDNREVPNILEELYLILSKIKKDFGEEEAKKILEKYLRDNL